MLTTRTEMNAIVSALEAVFDPLSIGVGDANAEDLTAPYVVAYPLPGGRYSGTLGNLTTTHEVPYQASCVGKTRDQSQWLADKASGILDGLSISGRRVNRAHPDAVPGTFRDDDVDPPLYTTPLIFRVTTT